MAKKIKKKIEADLRSIEEVKESGDVKMVFSYSQSSVQIKRGSKGNIDIEVKVYDKDIEDAREKAIAEFKEITEQFPID